MRRAVVLLAVSVLSTLASAQQSGVIALPAADKEIADATRLKALESAFSKAVVVWKGASPGISGSVTPLRTYLARNGMMCREFEEATQVPDTGVVLNRLACRDDKGTWHLVR